jgi:hypothetical protein
MVRIPPQQNQKQFTNPDANTSARSWPEVVVLERRGEKMNLHGKEA